MSRDVHEREPWKITTANSGRSVELMYESSGAAEPGTALAIAVEHGLATLTRSEVIALRDKLTEWIGDGEGK